MEGWVVLRLEDCKIAVFQDWKTGKWKIRRLESKEIEKLNDWNVGRF